MKAYSTNLKFILKGYKQTSNTTASKGNTNINKGIRDRCGAFEKNNKYHSEIIIFQTKYFHAKMQPTQGWIKEKYAWGDTCYRDGIGDVVVDKN